MTERKKTLFRASLLLISLAVFGAAVCIRLTLFDAGRLIRILFEEEFARSAGLPAFAQEPSGPAPEADEPPAETAYGPDAAGPPPSEETVPPSDETESEQPPENENTYPVINKDMSASQTKDSIAVINSSRYSVDPNEYAACEYPIPYAVPAADGSEPLVLIIHTHGTEAYLENGQDGFTDASFTRNTDIDKNVVRVGSVLANALEEAGIPTIHCETMFDLESYSASYDNSEKAVIEYLAKYPSIRYVFDVHRDYAEAPEGGMIKCETDIDGNACAQVMFVVGTDSQGAAHPFWRENLKVAAAFQYALLEKYPTLMRPINLRGPSFNAEHATGSILIEIGMAGNTLSEAEASAELIGRVIAEVIKKG